MNIGLWLFGVLVIPFVIIGVLFAIFIINHKVIFDYLFKSSYMPV